MGEEWRCSNGSGDCLSAWGPDLEHDATIRQGLLVDDMSFLAGLQLGFLDGVNLQKAIELLLLSPFAAVIVIGQRAREWVDDHGVGPTGQMEDEPGGLVA